MTPGRIVILNGAPRSGKSSIAAVIQRDFPGVWINLGVDVWMAATPAALRPGIGLRPGGERPDLEPYLPDLNGGLYEAVAAVSRSGLNVVMDVGHHDRYTRSLGLLPDGLRRLEALPVLLVGVRCSLERIMDRRNANPAGYAAGTDAEPIPAPVLRWQEAVHENVVYDLQVDTTEATPESCASKIREALAARYGL